MAPNRKNIEFILANDLQKARADFAATGHALRAATAEFTSDSPSPEAAAKAKSAGEAYQAAVQAYALALREFNAFLTRGTIPERLRKPDPPSDPAKSA